MELRAAWEMARTLLDQHGRGDWELAYDGAKMRAGACRHDLRVISLSKRLTRLHDEGLVRDTVLHEIAHALVGPRHHHDDVWRETARAIGCTASRCVPPSAPRVEAAWKGMCSAGHESAAHKRPTRPASCNRCSPSFSPDHLISWTWHGLSVRMHSNYIAGLVRLGPDYRLVAEQLAEDAALGGGADQTAVEARLQPRMPAGTVVTVRVQGAGELKGVIISFGKTRYKVKTDRGVVAAPPAAVSVR